MNELGWKSDNKIDNVNVKQSVWTYHGKRLKSVSVINFLLQNIIVGGIQNMIIIPFQFLLTVDRQKLYLCFC